VKSKKRVLLLEKDLTEVKNKLNLLEDARDALKKYKEGFSSALMSLEKIRDDQKRHKEKYDNLCIEAEGRNQKLIKVSMILFQYVSFNIKFCQLINLID